MATSKSPEERVGLPMTPEQERAFKKSMMEMKAEKGLINPKQTANDKEKESK